MNEDDIWIDLKKDNVEVLDLVNYSISLFGVL
jgi:hypothetical protein